MTSLEVLDQIIAGICGKIDSAKWTMLETAYTEYGFEIVLANDLYQTEVFCVDTKSTL